ncbi:hypothetical protein EV178_006188 [Coemansia sp. RSA 1646]|nr:hypothetical protein EV178_006188 [Coemansia sp. RSA 1646]KAJ1768264.1 hypothetical protein LPJ74_004929 [Coemansia sp. RSA 1843]KAJ2210619.1 hypothetical protein EV179_006115 [Coemansia sp. RSA 487]
MHRFYHHSHCYGGSRNIKGKILLVGVTLWLTSTIIAGVRRSTGRTHNTYPPPNTPLPPLPPSRLPEDKELQDRTIEKLNDTRATAEAQLSSLESEYIESAQDAYTREQRLRWIETRRLNFDHHWGTLRRTVNESYMPHYHHHRSCAHNGGFVRWYLGVGERTFDWMARKFAASHRFHWEDPAISHGELAARTEYYQYHSAERSSHLNRPPFYHNRDYYDRSDSTREYPHQFNRDNGQRHHQEQASDVDAPK